MTEDVVYLDTETSIKNRGEDAIGKNKASPFHPDNKICYTGWLRSSPDMYGMTPHGITSKVLPKEAVLVAQNVAFDLLHLLSFDEESWMEWAEKGVIWDVMLAEYLLTGQEMKWASLDELATIYGGTVKDSRIKEYWENDIDTEDIPAEEILPYLKQDVRNLKVIYEGQLKAAEELNMLPLIRSQMDARLATIIMEWNGMEFDKKEALRQKKKLIVERDKLREEIIDWMYTGVEHSSIRKDQLNPSSSQQISAFLFGGDIPYTEDVPLVDQDGEPIRFKSGKRKGEIKTKKTKLTYTAKGVLPTTHTKKGANGHYGVGDPILKKYNIPIIRKILTLREYNKQINTYFDGYSQLVWPDGKIHGQLNHCQTNTGRLSSSQPNLQNVSGRVSSTG